MVPCGFFNQSDEKTSDHSASDTANRAAAANRWKANGQLFAIRREGRDMYPQYARHDDFTPRSILKNVIATLSGFDALPLAGWF